MKQQWILSVIRIAVAVLCIGLVPQLRADVMGDWMQTNGPYSGEILAFYAAPKGVLLVGTVGGGRMASSGPQIAEILGHASILDCVLNPERIFRLLQRSRKRAGYSILARGTVYMHQTMMATPGITFRASKSMSPSVDLWLLRTTYTSAP